MVQLIDPGFATSRWRRPALWVAIALFLGELVWLATRWFRGEPAFGHGYVRAASLPLAGICNGSAILLQVSNWSTPEVRSTVGWLLIGASFIGVALAFFG